MPDDGHSRYRDLSQPIETDMQTFPGDPAVDLTPAAMNPEDGFSVHELRCGSHTGTHIDAPSHTEPGGATLDERDVGDYVFDARFVDVTPQSRREPIDVDELPDLADDDCDVLVLRTGWDEYWSDDRYLDHPFLTPAAAEKLRDAGCGVAVDALNPDPTPTDNATPTESDGFPVHHTLLGADLPILENLTGLTDLPKRFTLYAFPLPLAECDGAPVRAVAAFE